MSDYMTPVIEAVAACVDISIGEMDNAAATAAYVQHRLIPLMHRDNLPHWMHKHEWRSPRDGKVYMTPYGVCHVCHADIEKSQAGDGPEVWICRRFSWELRSTGTLISASLCPECWPVYHA